MTENEQTTDDTTTDSTVAFRFTRDGARQLAALKFAASTDSAREALQAIRYTWDSDMFTATTTNSYIMAERRFSTTDEPRALADHEVLTTDVPDGETGTVLVNGAAIHGAITSACKGLPSNGIVTVSVDGDSITVSTKNYSTTVSTYTGRYPKVDKFWPVPTDGEYTGDLPAFSPYYIYDLARATGFTAARMDLPFIQRVTVDQTALKPLYLECGWGFRAVLMPVRK